MTPRTEGKKKNHLLLKELFGEKVILGEIFPESRDSSKLIEDGFAENVGHAGEAQHAHVVERHCTATQSTTETYLFVRITAAY